MDAVFFPDSGIESETIEKGFVSRKIKARGGALMLVEVRFEAGAVPAVHSHPHEQASYCLSGRFAFIAGSEEKILLPGDSVYVPGGLPHHVRCLEKGALLDVFTPQREDFLA